VFADKLVSYEDKAWLDKELAGLCKADFPSELCKQVRLHTGKSAHTVNTQCGAGFATFTSAA
jgi:hypothetical protein